MFLKVLFLSLVPCAMALVSAPLSNSQIPNPVIQLTPQQSTIRMGSPVILTVELKNTTQHTFWIFRRPGAKSGEADYLVSACDAKGQAVMRTAYGQRLLTYRRIVGSQVQYQVDPGQSLTETADFSEVFSFSQSGSYTLQVEQDFASGEVKSNLATVTIQ